MLRVARRSAVKAHTQAANQLASLVVTAPEPLRQQLRPLGPAQLVRTAARLRPGPLTTPTAAAKLALRELARRAQSLSAEIQRLDAELARLARTAAPRLLARRGVGADVAGALLVVAGDNPERLRSEAAFSMLCGASPLPASSGRTVRHRLNRGGDRAGQQRPVAHRAGAHVLRRAHPQLRGPAHRRRQVQARDHPLPQALHRPRDLPGPQDRPRRRHPPSGPARPPSPTASGSTRAPGRATDAVTTASLPALNSGLPTPPQQERRRSTTRTDEPT